MLNLHMTRLSKSAAGVWWLVSSSNQTYGAGANALEYEPAAALLIGNVQLDALSIGR